MAGLHLVTGYKGTPHVTSADQGLFNAGLIGSGDYVLDIGNRFEAHIVDNNTIKFSDGCAVMSGRHVMLDDILGIDVSIASGTSLRIRHDIIALRYTKGDDSVESVNMVVIEGTPSFKGLDPTLTNTTPIISGSDIYDMPMYRVILNGLTIQTVEPLFQTIAPISALQRTSQNLLLNGDFQCNQRGNSEYSALGNAVMYTLDMWRAHKVKVKKRNDGIELIGLSASEQGYLTQFIDLGALPLPTSPYTISTMVDGKVCTFTVIPSGTVQEKVFEKFKISTITTSIWEDGLNAYHNRVKINICPIGTNSIIINYVDVSEGWAAYIHVKEDPAVAMLRCRRYLQIGTYFSPILKNLPVGGAYKSAQLRFGIPIDNMVSDPKLEKLNAYAEGITTFHNEGLTQTSVTTYIKTATEWQFDTANVVDLSEQYFLGVRVRYTLSCEHNPNGD